MISNGIGKLARGTLTAAAMSLAGSLFGAQTDTRGTYAVPAPGKVTIDGKLDDWDLSGKYLQCYDVETLKDVYSGEIAFMYDADHLYVAIHWKDPIPMGNSHDPRYQAGKGWAGDSVQLRLKTDRICHVTAWYFAANKEPAISIEYGKNLNEPFGGGVKMLRQTAGWKLSDGAEMAFLKDADGRGYVQELKLPWPLITDKKKYTAGDRFNCGVELLWGEGDWPVHRYADNLDESASSREFFWTAHNAWGLVKVEAKGNLRLPEPSWMKALTGSDAIGPELISYTLPKDARVTIAIDDQDGKRVRNLIAALPRKAGKNAERWDGLDDNGVPVQPGAYKWKGLYHDGIRINWDMSFASPGNPPWDTADLRGAFYGDHSPAEAGAAAGDYVALACPIGEAGRHLIGCDLDGQRLWGLAQRSGLDSNYRISLASDGKTVWVSNDGNETVYRVEAGSGRYSPWEKTAKDENGKDYQVLDLKVTDFVHPKPRGPLNVICIAERNGVLAVALAVENKIRLLDSLKGDVKSDIAVENPQAVAFSKDGALFALSGSRIVEIGKDGKPVAFNSEDLKNPFGIVVADDGKVYVSVQAPDHNVKVFSADGKLIGEIGKKGGRPGCGPFDENAMRNPGQLAIDSKGRLWVPEGTINPKRTSVWKLADGKFVKDFIGTTGYAGAGAIDPLEPTRAFSDDTVYKLDYKAGTYRPVYSLGPTGDPADIFPLGCNSHVRLVKNGPDTLLYVSGNRTGVVQCHILRDGVWRSAACFGTVLKKNDAESNVNFEHPFLKDHAGEAFAWADKNGDGIVQPEELAFGNPGVDGTKANLVWCYWGTLPDDKGLLTYYAMAKGQNLGILRYPVKGFTASGAPVYEPAKPVVQKIVIAAGEGMVAGGFDGNVYFNTSPLTGFDKDGKVIFTYPSRHVSVHGSHTAAAAKPGYLIGPSSILGVAKMDKGEAGEVFDMNGNLGENYLFTSDGLWIQSLFKDGRGGYETPDKAVRGMSFDATTAGGESFGGYFTLASDGKVRLVVGGTDARILDVTGLDSVKRISGTFNYTAADFAAAEKAVKEKAAATTKKSSCVVAKAAVPPAIDGKGTGFVNIKDESKLCSVEVTEEWRRDFRVALSYDNENLYVAWRHWLPGSSLRNAGQDWKLLFKTGDCVDLMLGPEKGNKGVGDLRLLISSMGGKPVAVLYRKNVPGTAEKDRVPFSSPWRTIYFDKVTQEDGVKVTFGDHLVEAAIPWKLLGIEPKTGLKLRGDFGVLSGDNTGTVTVRRKYWSNGNTGLVNDIPGEADLAPEAWSGITLE